MDADVTAIFAGHPFGLDTYRRVAELTEPNGPFTVRVTSSQIALARRRGFAYLWMPGRWLTHPTSEVVLSLALDHRDASPRFKEVAHPSARVWMHHLEVHDLADLDDEVSAWLREAYAAAG